MIFRTIDYESDPFGVEAAHLVLRELFGSHLSYDDGKKYKEMTDGWENYCLQDESTGVIAGAGTLDLDDIDKGIARVNNVAIAPQYRGEGLGKFLISSLEYEAYRQGAMMTQLIALESAAGFYESLGYVLRDDISPYDYVKDLSFSLAPVAARS